MRLGSETEVSQELALVATGVVHRNRVAVDIQAAGKVVRRKLPLAAKVTGSERHFGIDNRGIPHQGSHRQPVPDVIHLNRRVEELGIDLLLNAFGSSDVGIGEDQLQAGACHRRW